MKDKILKVLFIISFLPFLFILFLGIRDAILGIDILGYMIYGWDAFLHTFWSRIGELIIRPIIYICIIFQICYILKNKVIDLRKYVTICSVIACVLLLVWRLIVIFWSAASW